MHAWIPSWPAVAELALMAGLMFGIGSWRSGKALDRAYDDGWERCAAKVRRRQLDKLRAGLVLVLAADAEGEYAEWAEQRNPARSLAELAVRDMMNVAEPERDSSPHGGELEANGGFDSPAASGIGLGHPDWRDQIREQLSPPADVPRPGPREGQPVASEATAAPGHLDHLPLAEWGALMLREVADAAVQRERLMIEWEEQRLADDKIADGYIAAWVAESELALAGASWQDRLR
jgi:hypothetical protein